MSEPPKRSKLGIEEESQECSKSVVALLHKDKIERRQHAFKKEKEKKKGEVQF